MAPLKMSHSVFYRIHGLLKKKKQNKNNSSFNIIVYSFVLGVWDSVPPLPKDFCYYRNKQIVEYIHHFQQQLLLKISLQLSLQPTTESWKVNYIH